MARAKSRFQDDETNKDLGQHLVDAEKALGRAMDLCVRVIRERDGSRSIRAKHVRRDIGRALDSINAVKSISGSRAVDIDLMPEDQRAEISRQKRAEKRTESNA